MLQLLTPGPWEVISVKAVVSQVKLQSTQAGLPMLSSTPIYVQDVFEIFIA